MVSCYHGNLSNSIGLYEVEKGFNLNYFGVLNWYKKNLVYYFKLHREELWYFISLPPVWNRTFIAMYSDNLNGLSPYCKKQRSIVVKIQFCDLYITGGCDKF